MATRRIQLGDGPLTSSLLAVLGIVAFSLVVFVFWEDRPVLGFVLGCAAMAPFGALNRRLGRATVTLAEGALLLHPQGRLWFGKRLPTSAIRKVFEHRKREDEGAPVWALVFELQDGTRLTLGAFHHPDIHELTLELNWFVRSSNGEL